jgi:hypothetical protein
MAVQSDKPCVRGDRTSSFYDLSMPSLQNRIEEVKECEEFCFRFKDHFFWLTSQFVQTSSLRVSVCVCE